VPNVSSRSTICVPDGSTLIVEEREPLTAVEPTVVTLADRVAPSMTVVSTTDTEPSDALTSASATLPGAPLPGTASLIARRSPTTFVAFQLMARVCAT
jgi:hypothetical protein